MKGLIFNGGDCRNLFDNDEEMEEFMKKKAYLFLDEGYMFGESGKGFERINIACPTRVLEEALHRLNRALKER